MCLLGKVAYSSGSPPPFVVLKNKQTKKNNQKTKGTFTLMLICRVYLLFANYG